MPASSSLELTLTDPAGSGWQLAFEKINGQFQHRLQWRGRQQSVTLLTSWHAHSDLPPCPTWPTSPPLQQITKERQTAGEVILGIGMAGQNHYSASFLWLSRPSTLQIEFACRINRSLPGLASTYMASTGDLCETEWNSPERRSLNLRQALTALNLTCQNGSQIVTSDQPKIVSIQVNEVTPPPSTVRWSYQIQTISSPSL